MPRFFRALLLHIGISGAVWLSLVIGFGYTLRWQVEEEYRLGYRTTTNGDSLSIPIFELAILLGVAIAAINLIIVLVRVLRRRRMRPAL